MKQLTIISGKGGTGKTIVAASFAALSDNSVFADCDVDAANLHLLLKPKIIERHEFSSGATAVIDNNICTRCGKCREICRFSAIGENFNVNEISCEGCAFCSFVCPEGAITMREEVCGEWFVSETRFGPLVHAKLGAARENSGKLVSIVRRKAKTLAEYKGHELVVIDGSPGIGCPVIASIAGVDCALVVTEPSLSGLHDAKRVIGVAEHFGIPVKLVVNKYNLNPEMTEEIENYCRSSKAELIGKISFDAAVVKALVEGRTVVEHGCSAASSEIKDIWSRLKNNLG